MPADSLLAYYVVDHIAAFREHALKKDPAFFEYPENIAAFRDFVQALPYVFLGQQTKADLLMGATPSLNRLPA